MHDKQYRGRISRAEYDTLKANCAARINLLMERHNLSPSQLERLSAQAVQTGEAPHYVNMQDLSQYRSGRSLPKGLKLQALARVLKCDPEELVPAKYQNGRLVVSRKLDAANADLTMKLTPSTAYVGHTWLEARILLPVAKAYKLKDVLTRQHNVEMLRREGRSDEEIEALLIHAAEERRRREEGGL
jgi:transcriptional regulator with XRE-family HTH domain